jgi:hypothetical protein
VRDLRPLRRRQPRAQRRQLRLDISGEGRFAFNFC